MAKKFNLADYVQPEAVSDSDHMEIVEIPLPKIIANGRNFYGVRDVEELADDIALNGQMEPLIVYPYGTAVELYRLLSGHRRLAALQLNKAETALCRIVDKPASLAREDLLLIAANRQRTKNSAELAAEAERMTDALLALKKEGAELPGRLRDIVAETMGVSPTALARKKVINDRLKVPGFRQAWESGKMKETAAYELAQLPPKDQYSALDLAIDAGLDYEKLDIKTVQRIKRKVEAGESSRQELAAAAEKLGIRCPEGDYSPLLAYLVREALSGDLVLDRVRSSATKAKGVECLHNFGLRHSGTGGMPVCRDCDPGGMTITRPIRRRLKWPEVWELLALDAMQKAGEDQRDVETPSPTKDDRREVPDVMTAPTVTVAGGTWRSCRDDPPEGWSLCFLFHPWAHAGHDYDLLLVQYHNGRWFGVWEDSEDEIEIDMYDRWCPAPVVPEEVWE